MLKLIPLFVLSLTVITTAHSHPLPQQKVTEIAAYYKTTKTTIHTHDHNKQRNSLWSLTPKTAFGKVGQKQHTNHWYLWRQHDKIEIQSQNKQVGEIWHKLKHNQVEFTWLYHAEKFAIRYTPSDLKSLQNYPKWTTKTKLVSPILLQRLKKTGSKNILGYAAATYTGTVDGYQLEIDWIPAIQTPAKIKQTDDKNIVEVTLLEVYPLDQTPWKPIDSEDYDDMDYADIGDNESHPIVRLHLNGMSLSTIQYPEQGHGH